jgi:hypothetical protein
LLVPFDRALESSLTFLDRFVLVERWLGLW